MTAASGKKIKVRQIKSGIGFNKDQKRTLRALGLGKIGQVYEARLNEGSPEEKILLLRIDGEITSHEDGGLLGGDEPTTSSRMRLRCG